VRLGRGIIADATPDTVFTGNMIERETLSGAPTGPTFWGHFGSKPRAAIEPIQSVHSICNLFPRSAFDVVHFDEAIVYGYEELDLGAQLLAAGYRIEHRPQLVTRHASPQKSEAELKLLHVPATRARFYTTLKRHLIWQRSLLRVPAYVVLASIHEALHRLIRGRSASPLGSLADMRWAFLQAVRQLRSTDATSRLGRSPSGSLRAWRRHRCRAQNSDK
jgi:GT2 family glycosyltransferase